MVIIAIIFVLYLGLMVWIGVKNFNKTDSMSDYILGGRKLNSWVTAMSAQASDMSGWLLIGLPGTAYMIYVGTEEAIWTARQLQSARLGRKQVLVGMEPTGEAI